jgi:hypothetical protein
MTKDHAQLLPRRSLLVMGAIGLASVAFHSPPAAAVQRRPDRGTMTMYRDAGCGCCMAWANLAERAGYQVSVQNVADMAAVKRRLGVPAALASCHTVLVGGFVVEGHVPFPAVGRLLSQRPMDIRGIAVPDMPVGSPGMEVPGGTREPFDVIAFFRNGRTARFA